MNQQTIFHLAIRNRKMLAVGMLLCFALTLSAQSPVLNKQRHFRKNVPAGNYSGITWLGADRYAIVNDKSATAGFRLLTIHTDSATGAILDVRDNGFMTDNQAARDEEGICYVPHTQTLFLSGEADGQICEYRLDGQATGRRLNIPQAFADTYHNRSFEALTYNANTHLFWTTTENSLQSDGQKPSITDKVPNLLRFQSFGDDLQPVSQYLYRTDSPSVKSKKGQTTLGVSGLVALDDGRLIVLEREVRRTKLYIGTFVHVKLYLVNPKSQQPGQLLQKQLLTEFRTSFNLTKRSLANYEGICAGPRLTDGRLLLLLVADSQNQYKGRLKDWFKTVVL